MTSNLQNSRRNSLNSPLLRSFRVNSDIEQRYQSSSGNESELEVVDVQENNQIDRDFLGNVVHAPANHRLIFFRHFDSVVQPYVYSSAKLSLVYSGVALGFSILFFAFSFVGESESSDHSALLHSNSTLPDSHNSSHGLHVRAGIGQENQIKVGEVFAAASVFIFTSGVAFGFLRAVAESASKQISVWVPAQL